MPLDPTVVGAIFTTAVPILGGAGAWLYYRLNERHKSTLEEYRELLADQRRKADEQKADYAKLWQQAQDADVLHDRDCAQLRAESAAQRTRQDEEYRKLADRLVRAQVQNQALRGELQSARTELATARIGQNPIFSPGFWAFCIIVTNDRGVIIEANPGVLLLFHWSENEVVGQNVKVLIPPRFHAAHDAGMSMVRERHGVSYHGRVLSLFGLTKSGEEIPIDLQLESWQEGGELFCGASIRRRWLSTTEAGLISNAELPAFDPSAMAPVPAPVPAPVVPPAPQGPATALPPTVRPS
jgi:PAS domain S-box-containing protein